MYRIRGILFALTLLAALATGTFLAYRLDLSQRKREGLHELMHPPEVSLQTPPPKPAPIPAPAPVVTSSDRTEVVPAPSPTAPAVAPELAMGELRGTVTDLDGRPLADVRLLAHAVEDGAFRLPTPSTSVPMRASQEAFSGPEGRFRMTWPAGHPARITTQASRFAPAPTTISFAGQDQTIRLDPGIELFGSVTRPSGEPIGGATLRWLRAGEALDRAPAVVTGPAGTYTLRVAQQADSVLEVLPPDGAPSDWIDLPASAEPRQRLDFIIDPGWMVQGSVRDAETSLPVPGALVSVGSALGDLRTTTADSGGAYHLAGFGGSASRLRVQAPGYGEVVLSRIPQPADGAAHVDLVLERARVLTGRIVDSQGAPIPAARVTVVAAGQGPGGMREQCLRAFADPEGRFRIDGLSRDLEHALVVSQPAYASSVYDLPLFERSVQAHDVGDIALFPATRVSGHVRRPDGQGIGGVEVRLEGWNHDRGRLRESVASGAADPVGARVVRSAADGSFQFVDVPPGDFRVATQRQGAPPSSGMPIEVRGQPHEDLELVLDTGGFLAGRVLDPEDVALENVTVFARAVALDNPEAAAQLAPLHVRTDDQGRFSLTGLASGQYTLHAQPDGAPETSTEDWLPASLPEVRTGEETLVLRVTRGTRLRGHLTSSAGRALAKWLVSTPLPDGGGLRTASTDEEGRFLLLVPQGVPCEIEVRGPPGTASFERVQMRRTDVVPSEEPLELQLPAPGAPAR